MRTKGNSDIKKENKLVRYRLMSNLLQQDDEDDASIRNLTPSQRAHEILFKLDPNKNRHLYSYENDNGDEIFVDYSIINDQVKDILELVKRIFEIGNYESSITTDEAEKYIVRKIISISKLYSEGV